MAQARKTRKTEPAKDGVNMAEKAPEAPDRLIHERVRLAIISALAAGGTMSFAELKRLLDTSDGNLSVHARKLEEARYITCKKTFEGRIPKTVYSITDKGRRALEAYVEHMEAILSHIRASGGLDSKRG